MNRIGSPHEQYESRFGELSKVLPVLFVLSLVVVLYIVFVFLHGIPLLQLDIPESSRNQAQANAGFWQLVVFHADTLLLMYCFIGCIVVHPGTIPDTPEWQLNQDQSPGAKRLSTVETKHTGERRHCKWCMKYKPDRCHHCRVCNSCILRMDHHCPWIYNCVGYRNHKYFFLLLLYSCIDLHFIVFTMYGTTDHATKTDVPFSFLFLLIFGETLASFLAVLVTVFFLFHIWLMNKAMSTIEFCEKSLKKADYDSSVYNKGCYGNLCEVMGPNPLLWLLPISFPDGSGVQWVDEQTRLASTSSPSATQRRISALATDAAARTSLGFTGGGSKTTVEDIITEAESGAESSQAGRSDAKPSEP